MKSLLFGPLVFLLLFSMNLKEVRKMYPMAIEDPNVTDELYKDLSNVSEADNIILYGYKGATLTLKAKHAKSIKEKKNFFKKGADIIESALALNPDSIELHFIRLSVQENAPKILKYNTKIEEDKNFILKNHDKLDNNSIKTLIRDYIHTSKLFTEEEKASF
ncbi:hypothetical protein J8L85_04690 [Maribacter sp. MMG018]|uniref:hypothetical protein n=1 Tax=Maribacter sp. MMG018 TaxID=2822688 RepID=UPI001B358866|nr:hypothetical protein [Maribacter sp. MMG018]MBQ4913722.1 hypothetical protein [Maribacter sp. MMG018]